MNTGVLGYDLATRYIRSSFSNAGIARLSQAECPMLRAIALEEMTHRMGFDHIQVLWTHLGDTAVITVDRGEWGEQLRTVTDEIIRQARWKTEAARDSLAAEVLLHHENLRSAYTALDKLPPLPKFHDKIVQLAERDNYLDRELTMFALAALAKYRNKSDISLIRQAFIENKGLLYESGFRLMAEFPDTAYIGILEDYYPRGIHRALIRPDLSLTDATTYIQTLASYKCDSCAIILADILNNKYVHTYPRIVRDLKNEALHAILQHPCPAYQPLLHRYASQFRQLIKQDSLDTSLPLSGDEVVTPRDTTSEPVRW